MRRTVSCGLFGPDPGRRPGSWRDAARGWGQMIGNTGRTALSIVVPVWGTRHDLPRLLPALQRALECVEPRSEILVSAANTSLCTIVQAPSAVFVESTGSGYGDILQTGIEAAQGDRVITTAADIDYAA